MTNHKSISFKAYGKINLLLDIVGRRDDGYHLLNTVMQSVSVYDEISIELCDGEGIEILCDKKDFPCDETNLIWKAVLAFKEYTKLDYSGKLRISVKKNLPSMAGMGGGSADCAATLWALNTLFETLLDTDDLCRIGISLGADVPFCVAGGTILCQGIGEILNRLPSPECYFVIVKPEVSVSTPTAFKKYDSIPNPEKAKLEFFLKALAGKNLLGVCSYLFNALEYASDLDEIKNAKQDLKNAGALSSLMTGSGSAVFGIFENKEQAETAAKKLSHYRYCEVCKPVRTGYEMIKLS